MDFESDDFLSDFNFDQNETKEPQKINKISGGELEKFARAVLTQLVDDNVPPTPENFRIYFEKMIDGKSMTLQKKISELMEIESKKEDKQVLIENEVKRSFSSLKILLQDIAMIYKNTEVMVDLTHKRMSELSINSNSLTAINIIDTLKMDLERFSALLEKYSLNIKYSFEEVSQVYKSIEEQSDFDPKYGVYNKKFLLKTLDNFKEGFSKYNYQTSLIFLRVKESVFAKILSQKEKTILLKNISKILTKHIAKGDIIAHYENGIFVAILKHTNLNDAKKYVKIY
ncbi:hypothetical protein OLQ22_00730 [Campylobacter jejuni]|nr:hypothetical protein [Campylobacter jejuni]